MRPRFAVALAAAALLALLILAVSLKRHSRSAISEPSRAPAQSSTNEAQQTSASAPTNVYAHNLLLRKGPKFRIYVRWLRGQLTRSHAAVNPSFDEPDSFAIDVKSGIIRANVGDINN